MTRSVKGKRSLIHCRLSPGLMKVVLRAQHLGDSLNEGEVLAFQEFARAVLAIEPVEFGLVVEQLELAGSASHVQKNDALGFGGKVGDASLKRVLG